jgi:LacI family transcriptional regulator
MGKIIRSTLQDVAREAGVSLATADRAVHGRTGVSERTSVRVNAAVAKLGYRPDPAAARLARNRLTRIVFVLPEGTNTFVAMLSWHVRSLAPWLAEQRAVATIHTIDEFSPRAVEQYLSSLRGKRKFDAVVLMALDHLHVRAAIDELVADGMIVITLVSDVPSSKRHNFVGIDNVAAGRAAATLLGRFVGQRPGHIGVVLGSRALRDHAERLFGFEQVMAAEHPHLQLLPPIEGHDNSARSGPLVAKLLSHEPELVGLYSIGAGNRGIEAALTASGRAAHVVWICHELTPLARRALLDGVADAVINQDPGHEVRSACRLALSQLSGDHVLPDQERIRIEIFLKDNLP